jgi:hypothetical protein
MELDFPVSYQVEQLGHVDRSGGRRAYGFPNAAPLEPQQEPSRRSLADHPIVAVTPDNGDPWIGVFYGGEYAGPAPATSRLIGWPDERSFCVVHKGIGVVVRGDDPLQAYEIEGVFPITGVFVAPERGLVVFADFTNLTAYGADGLLWRSRRLALDEVRVEGIEGDALLVYGFFGSSSATFTVDTDTGRASGQPFQPRD